MSSSRPLFHTGISAFQRAGHASSNCPVWASPTSRRNWLPRTCGGLSWTVTEMEEMSKGEILLCDTCCLFYSVFVLTFLMYLLMYRCVSTYSHIHVLHGSNISVLSSVGKTERTHTQDRRAQRASNVSLAPHLVRRAGSGLGRRSDQPNEISQHTKCLSGPIRIPSGLPWVYLIDGKQKERSPLWVGPLVPKVGLGRVGLGWVGLGSVGMGWLKLGLPSTVTPGSTSFCSLLPSAIGFSPYLSQQSKDFGMLSLLEQFSFTLNCKFPLLFFIHLISSSSRDFGNI